MSSENPFESPSTSGSGQLSSSSSTGLSGSILKRDKRSVALYLKGESSKQNNSKPLSDYLDSILDPQKPIDDFENLDSCKWIISGGLTFEEFTKKVRDYDSSVMCGLVWTSNFVAYRCRTCGISPCMSICADCFQAGNHEGHDYNMFRSQAGGACDCGDASVMKPDGFCPRHGEGQASRAPPEPPPELMAVAKEMIPRLFLRLIYHLREQFITQVGKSNHHFVLSISDLEQFLTFIQSLSDMGAAMRRIMALALIDVDQYKRSTENGPDSNEQKIYTKFKEQLNDYTPYPLNFDKYRDRPGMSQKLEYTTVIEELVFWVVRYEFPQRLVTFLLGLLPDDLYKEAFSKAFVKHYSRISMVLMDAQRRSAVANRIVHISVQLFSNEHLAVHLTEKHNLLLTIILSLANMIQSIRVSSSLEDPEGKSNFHYVVNCEHEVMKEHCYWPVVSDLINVLSHAKIARYFLEDSDLLVLWSDLLSDMQGMNLNSRELSQHVEFEPDTYYAAFSAELEISASPMWSLLMHCRTPDTQHFVIEMIKTSIVALQDWFEAINFKDGMNPNWLQLTFHLPLHRYLATFIMTAVNCHHLDLPSLLPNESTLKKVMMHVLQIQVGLAQIYSGMWVRNGIQIKGQAMTYIQCHFCYSMADADLYLLQLCATQLDPDYFVHTVLERFQIMNWLSYSPEPSVIGSPMEPEHELAMVEGALSLFSALFSIHTYLGIDDADLVHKEMASLLCMNDRQHSTLMDLMPEKTGVNSLAKELFEPTLQQLAEYKAPNFEAGGGLQQGTYMPKESVWENDFDPVHVSQRAIYRRDMQSAMDRYTEFLRSKKGYKKKATPWPPFRIEEGISPSYRGIYRLLNCRAMHAFLFTLLHKAVSRDRNLPESILYHSVHLLNMCLHFAPKTFPNRPAGMSLNVHDCQLSHWYGTSDVKANACDVISEVEVATAITEEEVRVSGTSVDMDTSSLEDMFQLQPSTITTTTGPITSAQLGKMPTVISLPSLSSSSSDTSIKRYESRGVTTNQYRTKKITVKESIVSVLIKLHTKMTGSASYKPKALSSSSSSVVEGGGDGPAYITHFLDRLYTASSNAAKVIDETCRALNMVKVKSGPSDTEKDSKRRKAWNRQQKLMAEFASRQKAFLEQAMEAEPEESESSGSTSKAVEYDCVICNQSTPSTGTRPVGLVIFLQASSVLAHRHQNDQEFTLGLGDSQMQRYRKTSCGKVYKRKFEALLKHFEETSGELSVSIGWEGGVVAQTCGHYLHLDCHRSYLESLLSQSQAEVLAVNKREYWCPLCRQLSNCVIPVLPEESLTMLVKPTPPDPWQMVDHIAEMMVKRRIASDHPSLNRSMATVMEDLTNITYPSYRTFSSTPNTESVLLFISSVARTNLETELLQRSGTFAGPSGATAAAASSSGSTGSGGGKKNCFMSLLQVLSLHSKILLSSNPYPDLWIHLTGRKLDQDSKSVAVYEHKVPVLLKDPLSILTQFILTVSFTMEPEHLDFMIQVLYNLTYVQALTYLSCKLTQEEREAWRRKGRQSPVMNLEGILSNIISWLSRSSLFEEIDNSLTLPAICQSVWSPQTVEQTVQEFCLPFLRTCTLMKSHLFTLDCPETKAGQAEFDALVSFLNLGTSSPSTDKATASSSSARDSTGCVHWLLEEPHTLVRAWCGHLSYFINSAPQEAKSLLQIHPSWQTPQLIKLPKRYYQMFQMYRTAKCSECNRVPKDPAICLICGQLVCFRELCCSQNSVFESVAHSIECGAGTGMFLSVNSSIVVVIRGPRATPWGSVYLDEHGEEDRDLKRGKPLYLSQARYQLLESQWLSHSFDHVCKRWIWHRDQL